MDGDDDEVQIHNGLTNLEEVDLECVWYLY